MLEPLQGSIQLAERLTKIRKRVCLIDCRLPKDQSDFFRTDSGEGGHDDS